jgi:hypothetical protein
VELSKELTSISKNAFLGCTALKELVIKRNISSISTGAFEGCSGIERIYFKFSEYEMPRILVGENPELDNAELYFYSKEEPQEEGNYWHYSEDGTVEIWVKQRY